MSKYVVGQQRGQVAYDNREGKGAKASGALNFAGVSLKWWKPSTAESGYNTFDIVPYILSGKNLTAEQKAAGQKAGDLEFMLNYFVHRNVGPAKRTLLCASKTFGLPRDAACNDTHEAYERGDRNTGAALKSSCRTIMIVRPHGPNGPLGLHLFDVSHFLFTKELMEKASAMTRGKGLVPFYEPGLVGKLVECRAIEAAMSTGRDRKMTEFKDFMFYDRSVTVTDEEIESAPCLNDLLAVLSNEDFEAAYYGAPEDDTAEEHHQDAPATEAPSYRAPQAQAPSTPQPPPPAEAPAYNPPPNRSQASTPPPPPAAITGCPSGFQFGADCDAKDACAKCPSNVWRECDKASRAK